MASEACITKKPQGLGFFEKYLTVWVVLCILGGILLGKTAPEAAVFLDGLAISVNGAPVVSIPIAIALFFMMYPIMVKIDFGEVVKAGRSVRPVTLTLVVNWLIKPFTMYAIASFFLGTLFLGFIGPDAVDLVKLPLGLDLPVNTDLSPLAQRVRIGDRWTPNALAIHPMEGCDGTVDGKPVEATRRTPHRSQ